jgi:hypothetical protein
MSCVLRIEVPDVGIDILNDKFGILADSVHLKGELVNPFAPKKGIYESSEVNYLVSNAEFDEFDRQKEDAMQFLTVHNSVLTEIMKWVGVKGELDFGICRRSVSVQCDRLPAKLLLLAGMAGLDVVISQYPTSNRNNNR